MFPLVTVLIPAYNAAPTLRRAIDSALAQDYPNFEILVVDDGSRDATSEIVKSYYSSKIRLLRLAENRGEGGVLNEGIASANGVYIAFLDADDEWLPKKLSMQIPFLENNHNAIMVTCGCRFVDTTGSVFEEFGVQSPGQAKDQIWRSLLRAAGIAKPCAVVRTSAFKLVGGFDTTVPVAADQDMWIRLAMAGEVEFVEEYLTIAHDTPGSLTKTYINNVDKYVLPMINRHIASRRAELTDKEVREILGLRYTSVGRILYYNGSLIGGAACLLSAIALGNERLRNLWYLITASPPSRVAKKLLRTKSELAALSHGPRTRAVPGASLLAPIDQDLIQVPAGSPILIVSIDTEAEFDWSRPRARLDLNVQNVRQQITIQRIFDQYRVRPLYLVDYAVASQAEGYIPLRQVAEAGKCEIGAHLQAWENPPFVEALGDRTSFNHNLPGWLQKEKLTLLTELIASNFGVSPVSYRGGRYGVGEEIAWILEALNYQIDLSVLPGIDLRRHYGPDFRQVFDQPYWFGPARNLLEIPLTAGFFGLMSKRARRGRPQSKIYEVASRPRYHDAHVPGVLARLKLLERITLSPEGMLIEELKRMTRVLLTRGHRVFTFSYHSSSLVPGNTPYVRNADDFRAFVAKIEAFLDFFTGEIGGISMTPTEFRAMVLRQQGPIVADIRAVLPVG